MTAVIAAPMDPARYPRREAKRQRRAWLAERAKWRRHERAGRRDGRRFLPALGPDAAQPAHWHQISSTFQSIAQAHWTELVIGVGPERIQRAELLPELERARRRYHRAAQALQDHLAEPPVVERRHGEERLPSDLVARRRTREHEKRAALLRESRTRKLNYVFQLEQKRQGLEKAITGRMRVEQSAVKEQHRLFSIAAEAYLKGAQRTHHDPEALVRETYRFFLPLPLWVGFDDLGEFLKLIEDQEDH